MVGTRLLRIVASLALALGLLNPAAAAEPQKIVVYGGTGNIGQRIVQEALNRGHSVKVIVRDPSRVTQKHERLTIAKGDVLDTAQTAQAIAGQDAVVLAVSFRSPPNFEGYRQAAENMVATLRGMQGKAPRVIVVGGAGSLEVAPGKLLAESVPEAFRGEVFGQKAALDYYRTVSDVSWTYFSPAGSIEPGKRTGKFRLGGDQLVVDAKGQSRISMEDYAVALIDEIEKPAHVRKRFTIAY